MHSKLTLLTFATPEFRSNAELLRDSALVAGFDDAVICDRIEIESSDFYRDNLDVLEQKRGGGYWLWKPYLIEKFLQSASQNEIIFYCDAGRTGYYGFTRRPKHLIQSVQSSSNGYLLGPSLPHFGCIRNWTKRDCLIILDADHSDILNSPPLLATWSLWRPTEQAFSFLSKWLQACLDPRCLTDMPNTLGQDNYPDYRQHRHDQAIMSILAIKENADYLDFSRTLIQRALNLRPNSLVSHNFYKRPENSDYVVAGAGLKYLFSQYQKLRTYNAKVG